MSIQQLTQFDFHHRLAETAGLSLVWFSAPACGACRQLKRLFAAQPEAFSRLQLFEVDAGQEMALTREFEVFHLPAMFLFRDGHYHAPIHAEPRVESLLAAIETALVNAPQEAP